MAYDEAVKSIEIGIEIGNKLYSEGYDILGTGSWYRKYNYFSSSCISFVRLRCGSGLWKGSRSY